MNDIGKYRFVCNLTLSDILGQVIVWLGVIFAALASALSLMSKPIYSFGAVGLIVVTSLSQSIVMILLLVLAGICL